MIKPEVQPFSTTATGSNEGNSEQAQNNQNEDNNKSRKL